MSSLLRAIGELVLFVVLVGACGYAFGRMFSRAFSRGGGSRAAKGGSRAALRSPGTRAARTAGRSVLTAAAHPSNSQIRTQARADIRKAWAEARIADWGRQREHERANGTGGTATVTAPRTTLLRRLRPWTREDSGQAGNPEAPANGNGANGTGNGQRPANSTSQPAQGGTGGPPARPAPPPPAPASPASTNGGTTVPTGTSTASAEQMIEGINGIFAHAASGGINAKQEAVRAAREAAARFAGMMQMLSRTMGEPGSNYGPEITEPIAKAGQQFQAGAMILSEADNALETLANMTLREVSVSPRQAPHHNELAESGRH